MKNKKIYFLLSFIPLLIAMILSITIPSFNKIDHVNMVKAGQTLQDKDYTKDIKLISEYDTQSLSLERSVVGKYEEGYEVNYTITYKSKYVLDSKNTIVLWGMESDLKEVSPFIEISYTENNKNLFNNKKIKNKISPKGQFFTPFEKVAYCITCDSELKEDFVFKGINPTKIYYTDYEIIFKIKMYQSKIEHPIYVNVFDGSLPTDNIFIV